MLKTTSFTGSSTILQSLIDVADENKVDRSKSGGNETKILSPSSISNKKSTGLGYLTFGTKKTFNLLLYIFIQASIFQHFDPKRQM